MKPLMFLICFFLSPPVNWLDSFDDAVKQAGETHKSILINFSGSDWCGPCIRFRKEILETETFEKYAAQQLVLVRADFPRQKKNRLSDKQTQLNEALAERYNPDGKFPFTVLTDEKGKVIRTWDGFPKVGTEGFIQEIAKSKLK